MNASVGVLRGYLANAEKVRVRGAEFDGSARRERNVSFYGSAALHRRPLSLLPGRAAAARRNRRSVVQGRLGFGAARHLEMGVLAMAASTHIRAASSVGQGEFFGALDSSLSVLVLVERQLLTVSGRAGLSRWSTPVWASARPNGWTLSIWSRNLLNKDYYELLTRGTGQHGPRMSGSPGTPDRRRDAARCAQIPLGSSGPCGRCASVSSGSPASAEAGPFGPAPTQA